jgi:hypothetical protein
LRKNLKRMECKKLLDLPWNWVNNEMVDEVASKSPPPELKTTIRARLDKWTKEIIAAAFQISEEGIGLKKRAQVEPYMKYFEEKPNPTDGWRFNQCSNQDLMDVLKFLIPLIKPNKPTWLNVGLIATIVDCLFGDLKVSWADVFLEAVEKEVEKIDTHKDSYLPAYLIHLYQDQKALTKKETRKFTVLKRTMAMEDPEEEEEQEEPAKIVTEEFIDLNDQEEPTKQEKKSDQAIH